MAEVPERARETTDSEPMFHHPETTGTNRAEHADFIPKCITDKKYPLLAAFVVTILLIVIIALAARKPQPCSPCPPPADTADAACPDLWIGYHGKCYYKSEIEGGWNQSESKCSSFNATLALIDSQWDLNFLLNLTRGVDHWIGLLRQNDQTLKWQDGTEFRNQFPVREEGRCAYINKKGVSSTRCSLVKSFLCSQPDACSRKRKPHLTRTEM